MNQKEFEAKVAQMRQAQKNYFATRERAYLTESKALEREIDKELETRKNPDTQQQLFTVKAPTDNVEPPAAPYIAFMGFTEREGVHDCTTYVFFDEKGCVHLKTVTQNEYTGNEKRTTGMMNFDRPNTLALIEFLDRMSGVDGWIKTEQRKPEGDSGIVDVLIRHEGRTWKAIYICKQKQFEIYHEATEEAEVVKPEWWMPMPGEPKGGEK